MSSSSEKPTVWLGGEIKTPPLSREARLTAGFLLGRLQQGATLAMPHSRPTPEIGRRCHELRLNDKGRIWRIIYRIDTDAIIIIEVFEKKTNKTPQSVIALCKQRLRNYDS